VGADHSVGRELGAKYFIDLGSELKVERTDALHAVGVQVDLYFVPNVEPFGMVVQRFGDEGGFGHFGEGIDKILALKILVQFSIGERPTRDGWQLLMNFGVGEFFRWHDCLQAGWGPACHYYALGEEKQQESARRLAGRVRYTL
jgi:hypothetical protein